MKRLPAMTGRVPCVGAGGGPGRGCTWTHAGSLYVAASQRVIEEKPPRQLHVNSDADPHLCIHPAYIIPRRLTKILHSCFCVFIFFMRCEVCIVGYAWWGRFGGIVAGKAHLQVYLSSVDVRRQQRVQERSRWFTS